MAFNKSQSKRFKPRSVKIKNRLNGDVIEGILINEEEIEGRQYLVIRFLNGTVNKFNKEAYTLLNNSQR